MSSSVNDIFGQARQGSVAAIIQILNERLEEDEIRTRAVFEDGILQLLCEAPSPEQLEQSHVIQRVQRILETINPRRISKVNINSRIVCEQQLLWLEEINRDPDKHLLWSEFITLQKPFFLKRHDKKHHVRTPKQLDTSAPVCVRKSLSWKPSGPALRTQ